MKTSKWKNSHSSGKRLEEPALSQNPNAQLAWRANLWEKKLMALKVSWLTLVRNKKRGTKTWAPMPSQCAKCDICHDILQLLSSHWLVLWGCNHSFLKFPICSRMIQEWFIFQLQKHHHAQELHVIINSTQCVRLDWIQLIELKWIWHCC